MKSPCFRGGRDSLGRDSPGPSVSQRGAAPRSQGHRGGGAPKSQGHWGGGAPGSRVSPPLFPRAPGLAVPRWVRPLVAARCRVAMMAGWLWPGRRRPSAAVGIGEPPACHPYVCQAEREGYRRCPSPVPSALLLPVSIWRTNGAKPPRAVVISSPCYSFNRYFCLISHC